MVRSCAIRGDEEAVWLLRIIASDGAKEATDEAGRHSVVDVEWLLQMIGEEDSPCALHYRAWLIVGRCVFFPDRELMLRAARGGFAPAMVAYAVAMDGEEEMLWLRKAAALRYPEALYALADRGEDDLHFEAASLGEPASMNILAECKGLSRLQRERWSARGSLLWCLD